MHVLVKVSNLFRPKYLTFERPILYRKYINIFYTIAEKNKKIRRFNNAT